MPHQLLNPLNVIGGDFGQGHVPNVPEDGRHGRKKFFRIFRRESLFIEIKIGSVLKREDATVFYDGIGLETFFFKA